MPKASASTAEQRRKRVEPAEVGRWPDHRALMTYHIHCIISDVYIIPLYYDNMHSLHYNERPPTSRLGTIFVCFYFPSEYHVEYTAGHRSGGYYSSLGDNGGLDYLLI